MQVNLFFPINCHASLNALTFPLHPLRVFTFAPSTFQLVVQASYNWTAGLALDQYTVNCTFRSYVAAGLEVLSPGITSSHTAGFRADLFYDSIGSPGML